MNAPSALPTTPLPDSFQTWFDTKGWSPRPHQLALLERAEAGQDCLLIAPTGAGKTLAGFLPSLVDLAGRKRPRMGAVGNSPLHTLYISPLKALAVDVARNLTMPAEEMGLGLKIETRTGDTPASRRQRQKRSPPDILLTTPEQIALLLSHVDAGRLFGNVKRVIFDELHALVTSKRGDLLALGLARLRQLSPDLVATGLSATVADPDALAGWLVPQNSDRPSTADIVTVSGGAQPDITILKSDERMPWAGHMARYAYADVIKAIAAHGTTRIFVNTRAQAELVFRELWSINEDSLPIALHHGSLDVGQRRKVEEAMARNALRGVVATSTLDLGIDWGDVDLVIHVGAPKGASRLAQRIGRSNHRMDEPSKAILVPANRFEVLECQAALNANYARAQDTPPIRDGALDVLSQHVLGMACADAVDEGDLYEEVRSAYPYRLLTREAFERVVQFVATGGYALKSYERYARIRQRKDGLWRVANPMVAQQYRLNVGTIVEMPVLPVRLVSAKQAAQRSKNALRGGRILGQVEGYFLETLVPGDSFLFGGEVVRFEGIHEDHALVSRTEGGDPTIPSYAGGKFPLSTYLADEVRAMLAEPKRWNELPDQVADWLRIQKDKSALPGRDGLLVETFPRGNRHYMICYPFEGRLAHQTLGMLLTRRMERARAKPLGFIATDYVLGVWGLADFGKLIAEGRMPLDELFEQSMLGDDLEEWMGESYLLKRTFRACALISGLIEKRHPGQEKSGRQVTVSTDLIYDVLRQHEPDHILMQATWADAATGLLDIARIGSMLQRIEGRISHQRLERISPLAVPIMMQIGKEPVFGEARDQVLEEAERLDEDALLAEAMMDEDLR
ncbi:MAG: ligase-associated DNA damage response DEXH box helicase [Cohaesibacteraceae bacterium]